MISKPPTTLYETLYPYINIDADVCEPNYVAALPIKPQHATSNPRFIHEQVINPDNKEMIEGIVKDMKGASAEDVYSVIVGRQLAKIIPLIRGRVHAQTFPSKAYDADAMVAQAKSYVKAFNDAGVPTDRVCIKLPTTSAGVEAAAELKKAGIMSLGTCLFSVPQAVAASQAGMVAISMYFNEPLAGSDAKQWPDLKDPEFKHPMAARHARIRLIYDKLERETGQKQPHLKTASFVSVREVLAMTQLGAEHVTLGAPTLNDLLAGPGVSAYKSGQWKVPVRDQMSQADFKWETWTPPTPESVQKHLAEVAKVDKLSKEDPDWMAHATEVNYLEKGALDKANEEDEATKGRLKLALERFLVFEKDSVKFIEDLQSKL